MYMCKHLLYAYQNKQTYPIRRQTGSNVVKTESMTGATQVSGLGVDRGPATYLSSGCVLPDLPDSCFRPLVFVDSLPSADQSCVDSHNLYAWTRAIGSILGQGDVCKQASVTNLTLVVLHVVC